LGSKKKIFFTKLQKVLAIWCRGVFRHLHMDAGASVPLQGGSDESVGDLATFGVLTVSDRASQGIYEDQGGPAILNFFSEAVKSRCVRI
jgi:hypothetical protein